MFLKFEHNRILMNDDLEICYNNRRDVHKIIVFNYLNNAWRMYGVLGQ